MTCQQHLSNATLMQNQQNGGIPSLQQAATIQTVLGKIEEQSPLEETISSGKCFKQDLIEQKINEYLGQYMNAEQLPKLEDAENQEMTTVAIFTDVISACPKKELLQADLMNKEGQFNPVVANQLLATVRDFYGRAAQVKIRLLKK